MCGIVGIVDTHDKRDIGRDVLARMNHVQSHRGPDECGVHVEAGLGLGHRRLAIIDVATGQQPMFSRDRTVALVYNGEIYNFLELRSELEGLGHVFRTNGDTEVVVYAWQAWGERCVERFRGMFAFALWDSAKQLLFLARDRLGIKPLYYTVLGDGMLLFASELKSLMEHPGLVRQTDPRAVEDYFAYGYIPDPKTIFRNVHKLPPAHVLTVRRRQPVGVPSAYWDVPFTPVESADVAQIEEELISRLREAVRIRMISEVPLGAFLSGGVDSSAVVAMMAGVSNGPVNTCSISFGDPRYNEVEFANQVATRFRTSHNVEQVDPEDLSLIDSLVQVYDEPYADSSAIPTYRVCQLARKRVTVALSGDGGDENLAGYRRYLWHVYEEGFRSRLPQSIRGPLFGLLGCVYPKMDWAPKFLRAKSTLQALGKNTIEGYLHSVSVVSDELRARLFSGSFKQELQGYRAIEVLEEHARRAPTDHPLSRVQYLDLKTYLPGDILTKVDRASMAHSLEVRVPILDHHLVEWLSGLPPELKLGGREGKMIFKRALEPYLPKEILYRPKMGFSVPLAKWFRGPLRERLRNSLLGGTLTESGMFNTATLETMVDQHQAGSRDHSPSLWALLMFEAYCRNLTDAA